MKVINERRISDRIIDIPLDDMPENDRTVSPQKLFFHIYIALQIVSIVGIIATHGKLVGNVIWSGDSAAIFPDFVQTLWHSYGLTPYELHAIYPPLIYVICSLLTCLLPETILQEIGVNSAYDNWPSASIHPAVHMLSVAFFVCATYVLAKLVHKAVSNKNIKYKKLVVWTVFTSVPYIFTIERGNVVIWAVVALLYYCCHYASHNKTERFAAYICLAVAVSLKLYPVVFGILILQGKDGIKRAVECILVGITVLFLPFAFTGGVPSFQLMLSNLFGHIEKTSDNLALRHKIGIISTLKFVDTFTDISTNAPDLYAQLQKFLPIIVIVIGAVGACIIKPLWKKCLILTIAIILFPNFSLQYNLLYLVVPLTLFLREDRKAAKKIDFLYAVMFALCFAPLAFGASDIFEGMGLSFKVNLGMMVPAFTLIALLLTLFFEGVIGLVKKSDKTIKPFAVTKKYVVCFSVLMVGCISVLSLISFIEEYYITRKWGPFFEVVKTENIYNQETSVDHMGNEMRFNWSDKRAVITIENKYSTE